METSIGARFKRAWNAFTNRDPTYVPRQSYGMGYGRRPDRVRMSGGNERSIITAVYNRIAVDVAAIDIMHVELDDNGRFKNAADSYLNECLTLEANIDQTARSFIQDAVMTMFNEGVVAIVPDNTSADPALTSSYDIYTLRVGHIIEWYPQEVKVRMYNEITGLSEDIVLRKRDVGIVENPFYAVMNESNSTAQRLIRKLNLLDVIDEQSGSGKLDLIFQLPYTIKTETQRIKANDRIQNIENQLKDSKLGIAYMDATEHVTQLNRPVENNLLKQVEYLTSMLFSQLGITQSILDGTADDKTMLNYTNRTVEPIISRITNEMKRKFLSITARTRGQSIEFFRSPFRLVPVNEIAEIADKFTRNEIMTSNEIRQIVGMKPSDDPKADELRNKNLSQSSAELEEENQQPAPDDLEK